MDLMRFRKVFQSISKFFKESGGGARFEDEDDSDIDPYNPFPSPVPIEFGDVIDLHSIPPRQVKGVVEDFLADARRRRVRWVRIIHGKGIGVQREMVRGILSRTPFVIEYSDAPPEAGGRGATLATLSEREGERGRGGIDE